MLTPQDRKRFRPALIGPSRLWGFHPALQIVKRGGTNSSGALWRSLSKLSGSPPPRCSRAAQGEAVAGWPGVPAVRGQRGTHSKTFRLPSEPASHALAAPERSLCEKIARSVA